jgi:hypothetical protein
VHILWGDKASERTAEIAAFAEFLREEAAEPHAFSRTKLPNVSRSWRISDHYPFWAEFALPG